MNNKKSLPLFGIPVLMPFMKPFKKKLIMMIIFCMLGCIVDVIIPIGQSYAIDHYIAEKTYDSFVIFIIGFVFIILFSAWTNYVSCTNAMTIEVSLNRDLRNAAFTKLQQLSLDYYNTNSVGYIHARVMSDASRIGGLMSWTIAEFSWRTTVLIGSIIVMFVTNWRLALWIVSILPVMTLVFSIFQSRLIRVNRQIRETNSIITSNFNEGITGAKTIKTLTVEEKMNNHFRQDTAAMVKRSNRGASLHGLFAATLHLASSVAIAIVLWKGGFIAASEIGVFSMFMSYAQGMMEPVRWIIDGISNLISTQINIERLFKLINTEPTVKDTEAVIEKYGDCFNPKYENWEEINGDIEFKDVGFIYPDGDEYVFEHFNLKIPKGSNIAIVGETGAGKSTLVNLACRFFEPTDGQVLIDGRDARERSQVWLHSAIGYVLQSPHLFSGSILDNLRYGNENATIEEIEKALELVSANDVVDRLEYGLDTKVGEGGDMLSTGEKQLISFARAILSNPKILILDEATASVDTVTEKKIQSAIETIIRDRTTIMIAHRLSTVRNADLILVVNDGKIVEQGKHDELMERKSFYYDLVMKQYEEDSRREIFN